GHPRQPEEAQAGQVGRQRPPVGRAQARHAGHHGLRGAQGLPRRLLGLGYRAGGVDDAPVGHLEKEGRLERRQQHARHRAHGGRPEARRGPRREDPQQARRARRRRFRLPEQFHPQTRLPRRPHGAEARACGAQPVRPRLARRFRRPRQGVRLSRPHCSRRGPREDGRAGQAPRPDHGAALRRQGRDQDGRRKGLVLEHDGRRSGRHAQPDALHHFRLRLRHDARQDVGAAGVPHDRGRRHQRPRHVLPGRRALRLSSGLLRRRLRLHLLQPPRREQGHAGDPRAFQALGARDARRPRRQGGQDGRSLLSGPL
ncbi:hypothetical protein M885DRAFT_473812, partial [Pelagophyceae sp. CCMP2097]